ncbi:FACT complex subunit POB3 [Wickerhamiella sorbophila]|uniref:FACT complex subunit POB3 n=1 Tax=Wickerhamiella sorbophila TaxID=45607 RepID=A0A2T0FG95_9ASCO|nr:FACT complex subunit POB3 [Wickerhamiella sorbophila]PRT54005.1 FACT complex subunit POB3 [Wickerhamiella sorbophila]
MATQYDAIYFNQSRLYGQIRMSESGLGWKATEKAQGGSAAKVSEPFLLPAKELLSAQWSRGAKGYMLRIQTKTSGVVQLDGFDAESFNSLKNALSNTLDLNLEAREHSMRGWNWGSTDFERNELVFNVGSRPDFEIPYSAVLNSNVVGKSEVAIEFKLQSASERTTGGDEVVEMQFYVPGTVSKDDSDGVKSEDGVKKEEEGEEPVEEQSAAVVFHEQLRARADIGMTSGSEIVAFADILFLTPRGRYDMDMYEDSFRLRGKSYDYKIGYNTIQRIFVLPKPDDTHNLVILQLDPPLRQGQTRYPFLIMQFLRDEDLETTLNVDDEEFNSKYNGRLEKSYDAAAYQVISNLFKGLANRKITFTGSFISAQNRPSVNCSLKASEGNLYILEKAVVFVSKSPVYIPFSEIATIQFSRVGGTVSSSRTFDMTITLRGTAGDHQFSNIYREEQQGLDTFFRSKNVKVKNEIVEEQKIFEAALEDVDSDIEMAEGSQDEESEDEDFDDDEESDVAEEFDSNADSDSEGEFDDDEGSDASNGSNKAPPSKKPKTKR